jgi:hypothetical protein
MKPIKIFSWIFIIIGVIGFYGIISGEITSFENELKNKYREDTLRECGVTFMPMWKHWLTSLISFFGGIFSLYYLKKLKKENENDSAMIKHFKEGKFISVFMIGLCFQLLITDFNYRSMTFTSVVILIFSGLYLFFNYLLRKEISKSV